MAENVTNELLLEHMKKMQATLADHSERFDRVDNRLTAIEGYIVILVKQAADTNMDFASLATRVDRIERRLSLGDG